MRVLIIDPHTDTVIETTIQPTFDAIRAELGCEFTDSVIMGPGIVGYVDDEGLLKPNPAFFWSRLCGRPIAGKMVITGTDAQGQQDILVRVPEDQVDRLRRRFPGCVDDHGTP